MAKKYIDTEKLKSIIKVRIKERKEWMKDIDRSDRQDQLWSDLNGEDMSILQIIDSLQQEQPEVDLVTEYDEQFYSDPVYGKLVNRNAGMAVARHFYELGKNSK